MPLDSADFFACWVVPGLNALCRVTTLGIHNDLNRKESVWALTDLKLANAVLDAPVSAKEKLDLLAVEVVFGPL